MRLINGWNFSWNFNCTHAGNLRDFAQSRRRQALPNLPGEDGWVLPFVLDYGGDDSGGEESRSAPPCGLGLQESRASVTAQDLADAAVGHLVTQRFPLYYIDITGLAVTQCAVFFFFFCPRTRSILDI